MTVLICNSFDVSCSPPSPGRGCGVLCDPRAMAGTGTRARNESHQAHSRLLMSRTVDPRPVHATTPRGSSASSRGAQRDSHRDRRITGGAAAPATSTRSQQKDEIEPRSTSKHDQSCLLCRRHPLSHSSRTDTPARTGFGTKIEINYFIFEIFTIAGHQQVISVISH
jgi:hypothetical protein